MSALLWNSYPSLQPIQHHQGLRPFTWQSDGNKDQAHGDCQLFRLTNGPGQAIHRLMPNANLALKQNNPVVAAGAVAQLDILMG